MAVKDIIRGIGAAAETFGAGMQQHEQRRYERHQQTLQNRWKERQVSVQEAEAAANRAAAAFNKMLAMEDFNYRTITEPNKRERQRALDRGLRLSQIAREENFRLQLLAKESAMNKEQLAAMYEAKSALLKQAADMNLIEKAQSAGIDIWVEEYQKFLIGVFSQAPLNADPKSEEFQKWAREQQGRDDARETLIGRLEEFTLSISETPVETTARHETGRLERQAQLRSGTQPSEAEMIKLFPQTGPAVEPDAASIEAIRTMSPTELDAYIEQQYKTDPAFTDATAALMRDILDSHIEKIGRSRQGVPF